jgi:DNA topoisomerase-3
MRVFVAEKPSLARVIAECLPGPQRKQDGYIECGPKDVVVWCAGHILEMAAPEEYSEELRVWRLDQLPIVPAEWKLQPKIPELLKVIKSWLGKATRVVNAGDPDREGQLLVDEVLRYLGYGGPVDRVLINDLNPAAVRKALSALEPNAKFASLYEAAVGRQRADWLYGLNLTRLYTLLGRSGGYDGVLSVGRVQTPLLGLVVARDRQIEGWKSKTYWTLAAAVETSGGAFSAGWRPGPSAEGCLDEDGRLVSHEKALELQRACSGRPATVVDYREEAKTEQPPLPYSLAELQKDAGKKLGMSAKAVLDACQSLYETRKLTTYPRSDCSHLPEGQHGQCKQVLSSVARTLPALADVVAGADQSIRSSAWNDKKVTAHHAIIPTNADAGGVALSEQELAIYSLIARRYVAQFYPPYRYRQVTIELRIGEEQFRATGRTPVAQGWKAVVVSEAATEEETEKAAGENERALPVVSQGADLVVKEVVLAEKATQPPKRFTDSTLIDAMVGIARFVTDPRVKKVLKETDGIGTSATRAAIIENLFARNFLVRKGRQVLSTDTGRAFIDVLPPVATTPDQTALWEVALRGISEGSMTGEAFTAGVVRQVSELVARGKAMGTLKIPGAIPCPRAGCSGFLRRRKGKTGYFWACSTYPECKQTAEDDGGKPRRGQSQGGGGRSSKRRGGRGRGRREA